MNSLVAIFVCIAVVLTFGFFLLGVARLLGVKARVKSVSKDLPFECGLKPEQKDTSRVLVGFYLTAVLFVLFDIEIIFLYPWALSFKQFIAQGEGVKILMAMGVFLLIFIYGLMWELFSKALHWR